MDGVALRLLIACVSVVAPVVGQAQSFSRVDRIEYHDDTTHWVLGQPARQIADGIVVAETAYDARAQPYVFKSFGRTLQTIGYAQDGSVSSIADGNGNSTLYGNWKRGVPRSVRNPDGTTASAEIDDAGSIRSITDENGFVTQYTYDPMGRLVRTDYPAGDATAWAPKVESFAQSAASAFGLPAGHWEGIEITGNRRKVSYFDALWRPVLVLEEDAANPAATQRFQRFAYDSSGRVTFSSFSSVSSTETRGEWSEYDALGRLTSTSQDSELGLLTELSEYLSGHRVRTTRPNGYSAVTTYMAFDRPDYSLPVRVELPERVITDIQRDSLGTQLSITRRDQNGGVQLTRRYIYDASRQMCRSIEPETGSSVFGYDAAGNVLWSASGVVDVSPEGCGYAQVDAAQRVERTYDQRNSLRTLVFPDGLGNQVRTYAPDGLVQEIRTRNDASAAEVVNAYSYNRRRLPSMESLSVHGSALSLSYSYAADGSLASHVYPSGQIVEYQPNALGQPTRAGTLATSVTYHPNGSIARFAYGNGIQHVSTQNGRRSLSRIVDGGPASALDLSYGYDSNGNVTSITDGAPGGRATQVMSYDGLDRLLTADSPMFGGDQRASFTYDAIDNLLTFKVGDARSYVYGYSGRNQLQTVSRASDGAAVVGIAYDAQGNVSNKNGVLHQFDAGNRLRVVTGKESYAYDGHGRRVEAVSPAAGTITSFYDMSGILRFQNDGRVSRKSEYIYLGGRLVARADVSTLPPPDAAPILTLPAASSSGSYSASWSSVTGADRYRLEERINGGGWSSLQTVTGTSWGTSGRGSATYGYRVSACNVGGCGPASVAKEIVVLVPPPAPTIAAPSLSIDGNYPVSWSVPATAQTFRLEEQVGDGGSWVAIASSSQVAWQAIGRPNGSFYYRVQACNASGCGAFSTTVSVIVRLPPTHIPTLNGPSVSATGSFDLNWNPGSGVTIYEVQERVSNGAWSNLPSTGSTSIAIAGKSNGVYGFRVRSCNSSGCAPFSDELTVSVLHVPGTSQVSAPGLSINGSYVVGWSLISTATAYRLEEQVSGAGWSLLYSGPDSAFSVGGRPNGVHYYRVQACNSSGCGALSVNVAVTVRLPPADPPSISSPASSTTGLYAVNWTGVATAESYQLEERVNGGGWTLLDDVPYLSRYISQRPTATYQYRVRACNTSGCGPYSAQAQTVVNINRIPAEFYVRYRTAGYPQQTTRYYFFWNPIVGATRYEINTIKQQTLTVLASAPNPYETAMDGPPMHFGDSYRIRSCDAGSCSEWSDWVKHASY